MKFVPFTISIATIILILLPLFAYPSKEHGHISEYVRIDHKHVSQEVHVSDTLSFEIKVHGFILWASMGFLIPVGILIIRISNGEVSGRRIRITFYAHATLQMLGVLLATAGAIMSFIYFENSFENAHQRLGLTLYGAVWLQALLGILRPKRGSGGRSIWYVGHWVLGTTVLVLGVINVYTGLYAYHKRTSTSISLWTVLFTIQISIIAFLYLFQDKWAYIQKQRMVLGHVQPTGHMVSPRDGPKELL